MKVSSEFGFETNTAERAIIELLFLYMILCEYQLLDLQASVRGFVDRMSAAVSNIDGTIARETQEARVVVARVQAALDGGQATFTAEEVAKLLSAVGPSARIADSIQSDLYTLIECLSFEDIQSQRLDHLARASNALNMGIIERLRNGLDSISVEDVRAFGVATARATRAMYTMPEERDVFDQVFLDFLGSPGDKATRAG
jgi:hypothetical protein